MNLSVIEDHLLRALQRLLEGSVDLHSGPAHGGPASGMRAELFVHAARYSDLSGSTADGAHVGRRPAALDDGASGFSEARPALVDIEVTCHCAQHAQAHALVGLVAAPLLEALETLQGASLGDPGNPHQCLRFTDHTASLHACTSRREMYDGIAVAQVLLTLRLQGYLHVQLVRRGGLHKKSPYDLPLRLTLQADPAGPDLQREHALIHNDGESTVDLGGWSVQDSAPRRSHRYTFTPGRLLAPGATLRLWSGRGKDDAGNVYWGRRQAVWTNTGDTATLFDPDGVQRAQVQYVASPSPPPAKRKRR